MKYLARRIGNREAEIWNPTAYTRNDGIRADALTKEFRTTNDTLSFWKCEDTPEDLAEIALALAGSMTELSKFWIVLIDQDFFESKGFQLKATLGTTPIQDLRNRHIDIVELDAMNLTVLAQEITQLIRQSQNCYLFTKQEVSTLLRKALENKRLLIENLDKNLAQKLTK